MEISKSRMAIIRALESEMEQTPIDKVNVTHLCKIAGVPRSTFYKNFDDIYDVVNWLWRALETNGLLAIGDTLNYDEGNLRNFENVLEYKNFFMLASRSKSYSAVLSYAARETVGTVIGRIEKRLGRELSAKELTEFKVYAYGSAEVFNEWVLGGMKEPPEFMAKTINSCMPQYYKDFLEPQQQDV